jgi:sialic acid synthase SpsE
MILTLKQAYPDCPIGYSGHEVGLSTTVAAVALGACLVERHITLDRAMYGSDQAASLEKRGIEMVTSYIRTIPFVMGDGVKRVTPAESINAKKLRYYLGPLHGKGGSS